MTFHEPLTAITDYLLFASATYFGVRLWRGSRAWSLAFVFTGLGSLLGGTYHALAIDTLWKPAVFSIGLASCFLLIGVSRRMTPLAIFQFMLFATWMIRHDDFTYVIADYGATLIVVAIIEVVMWVRRRSAEARWILGSIVLSVVAAVVQQSGFDIHRYFDHNALYHIIQLAGLWLLYRGGRIASGRIQATTQGAETELPTSQPT